MVAFREEPVDSPIVEALLTEYFALRAASFPPAMGDYTVSFPDPALFRRPSGGFIVVEDADLAGEAADVGCGGIRRIPSDAPGVERFEVKHVFLQPHVRGRGFGRLLLAELERLAVELGATELVLDTTAVLEAAGALYRSSGYAEVPPYNDNPNATNWYGKTLTP